MIIKKSNAHNPEPILQFRVIQLNVSEFNDNIEIIKGKWHSFLYITGGNGVLQIDFDEHIAIKKKIFFIEKYKLWSWVNVDKIEGIMLQFTDAFYNLIYTGNPKIKSDQSLTGDVQPFIKIDENKEREWRNVMDNIINEYALLRENSKEILCLSLKILILMYRRNALSYGKLIISDRKKQLLNEFRILVNNKFSELKTPKEFAEKLNISPNYLNVLCKEIYFKTVSEIISERIILEAKRLLAHSGLSVTEISNKLGFADNSYFGRYFKNAVGIPPDRYRIINYQTPN